MWLVYQGSRKGATSISSRAFPGQQIRVQYNVPFLIDDADGWLAQLDGFYVLEQYSLAPTIKRQPISDLTYLTRYEAALIEGLAASCPDPARVVELGTGKGLSTSRLLYGLSLHQDARLWTFDLEKCEKAWKYLALSEFPVWRIEFVTGDSSTLTDTIGEPLDLIYVDANHSYEGVKKDILAWSSKLKRNGVMALHDYNNPTHEVTAAIDELLFNNPKWELKAKADTMVAFEYVD